MTHYGHFVAIFATGNMVGKSMIIKPGVSYLCWRASIAQYSNFFKKWCPLLQNQRKVFFFQFQIERPSCPIRSSRSFLFLCSTFTSIPFFQTLAWDWKSRKLSSCLVTWIPPLVTISVKAFAGLLRSRRTFFGTLKPMSHLQCDSHCQRSGADGSKSIPSAYVTRRKGLGPSSNFSRFFPL